MVVRGAMCNTDHMMLRLKVRIEKKPPSKQEDKKGQRFDVAQLGRGSGGTRNKDTVREKYVAEVSYHCPRKEICHTVTTGEASHCMMWWGRWWHMCFRSDCRN